MEPSCVRQTNIPGTSKLFGDFLYDFPKVSEYYGQPFSDLDALVESARTLQFPDERRARIVAALRKQNGSSKALDKLAQPGTVAVVTGQQVGLFSGPAYTIFKALTAVRLAAELEQRGVAAVPVFWLATEDHDLAEVDHAWLFDATIRPTKVGLKSASLRDVPVGTVSLGDIPFGELQQALGDLPHCEEVLLALTAAYNDSNTYGGAFRSFLGKLLADFGLLYLDPLEPAIREIGGELLANAARQAPSLVAGLRRRSGQLEEAGYHAQVHLDPGASLLFHLHGGRRSALKLKDGQFSTKDRTFSADDLAQEPASLSPNALLRPVMQDYMLPTVSYVGGPAEIAYFAQSQVLYQQLLGRMPVIYPRNSFTLLDERADKLLARYELQLTDLLHPQDSVRNTIAAKLVPHDLRGELNALRSNVTGAVGQLREKLLQFDPTLAPAAQKSLAKISYQVEKLAGKTARETMRRDKRADSDADHLLNLIYPQRHLQERFYSIVPFLAKYGLDLPKQVYEFTQLSCPDHMVRTL